MGNVIWSLLSVLLHQPVFAKRFLGDVAAKAAVPNYFEICGCLCAHAIDVYLLVEMSEDMQGQVLELEFGLIAVRSSLIILSTTALYIIIFVAAEVHRYLDCNVHRKAVSSNANGLKSYVCC